MPERAQALESTCQFTQDLRKVSIMGFWLGSVLAMVVAEMVGMRVAKDVRMWARVGGRRGKCISGCGVAVGSFVFGECLVD